jgi:hypothetical protein
MVAVQKFRRAFVPRTALAQSVTFTDDLMQVFFCWPLK